MKSKSELDFKTWIEEQVRYYSPILGLDLNVIEVIKNTDGDEFICITCTYPYLDPTIKYSDRAFDKWKKGRIAPDRILHELCHILTDPLYVKAIERYASKGEIADERERLTDTFAAIIRRLEKGRKKRK